MRQLTTGLKQAQSRSQRGLDPVTAKEMLLQLCVMKSRAERDAYDRRTWSALAEKIATTRLSEMETTLDEQSKRSNGKSAMARLAAEMLEWWTGSGVTQEAKPTEASTPAQPRELPSISVDALFDGVKAPWET